MLTWPVEDPTPRDRHGQGEPCAFCGGRVPNIESALMEDRHAIVHGFAVCKRRCLLVVDRILMVVISGR